MLRFDEIRIFQCSASLFCARVKNIKLKKKEKHETRRISFEVLPRRVAPFAARLCRRRSPPLWSGMSVEARARHSRRPLCKNAQSRAPILSGGRCDQLRATRGERDVRPAEVYIVSTESECEIFRTNVASRSIRRQAPEISAPIYARFS